jgi:hypothetical protein
MESSVNQSTPVRCSDEDETSTEVKASKRVSVVIKGIISRLDRGQNSASRILTSKGLVFITRSNSRSHAFRPLQAPHPTSHNSPHTPPMRHVMQGRVKYSNAGICMSSTFFSKQSINNEIPPKCLRKQLSTSTSKANCQKSHQEKSATCTQLTMIHCSLSRATVYRRTT